MIVSDCYTYRSMLRPLPSERTARAEFQNNEFDGL